MYGRAGRSTRCKNTHIKKGLGSIRIMQAQLSCGMTCSFMISYDSHTAFLAMLFLPLYTHADKFSTQSRLHTLQFQYMYICIILKRVMF